MLDLISPFAALPLSLALAAPAAASPSPGDVEPFTPAEFSAAVRTTIDDCTVSAAVGPAATPLPLKLSNFLLDRPELAAFIVRRRRLAPYRIEMLGPRRSEADDGAGTAGVINLVERTDTHRVYYGEGTHRSLLFPDIRAMGVIIMDLREETSPEGKPRTVTTFRVYVRLRNRFVSSLVKTLRIFLRSTITGKFTKAFDVADRLAHLMASRPDLIIDDVNAAPATFDEDRAAMIGMLKGLGPPWTPTDPKR